MSTPDPQSPAGPGREPTEEELRAYEEQMAAYEEQLASMPVEQLIVSSISQLLQVGGMRAGLAPGTEGQRDPAQLRLVIEAVSALKPIIADALGPNVSQVDQALAQLQRAYAQIAGTGAGSGAQTVPTGGASAPGGAPAGPSPAQPDQPGPAQSSGRLWVPGQ